MDLMNELMAKLQELSASIKLLRTNGTRLAEAERDYKVTLRQEALKLRDSGMAVTLIDKVVYGEREVAEKRMKRDCAQAMYQANQEHINVTKLQIRILESQIDREWKHA